MDFSSLTMPQVVAEAEAIEADAHARFGKLDAARLNWKPSDTAWSVAQCLEHLINTNRALHGPIDEVLAGRKSDRWIERVPGLAAGWGRLMVAQLSPQATRRLKAPTSAVPSTSAIAPDIVSRFVTEQRGTVTRMRALDANRQTGRVITSPYLRVVVYSTLDACRLIVAHERRHFAQAERVMSMHGFPG